MKHKPKSQLAKSWKIVKILSAKIWKNIIALFYQLLTKALHF